LYRGRSAAQPRTWDDLKLDDSMVLRWAAPQVFQLFCLPSSPHPSRTLWVGSHWPTWQ